VNLPPHRLGRRALHALWIVALAALLGLLLHRLAHPGLREAGVFWRHLSAAAGALLLLVPMLFSITKRSGLAQRPPSWFVAHVLASILGLLLVMLHASGGRLLSVPGALLLVLLILVLQGVLARLFMGARFSQQFGSRPMAFHQANSVDRSKLRALIEAKRNVLRALDAQADEAVFSPSLRHALRHPLLSWRYARLAAQESHLVGARARAGRLLAGWRRVHMALAALFFVGVLAHVMVVTFFAGYAAAGRPITWWHLAAWGATP
jgi:hypothetical protein